MTFTEHQLQRYARHIILREVGGHGQQRLLDSRVRVTGSHQATEEAARYLAAAGVGTLVLDESMVERLETRLRAMNPDVNITADGPWDGTAETQGLQDRLAGAMAALATLATLGAGVDGCDFSYDGREARWTRP